MKRLQACFIKHYASLNLKRLKSLNTLENRLT